MRERERGRKETHKTDDTSWRASLCVFEDQAGERTGCEGAGDGDVDVKWKED